MPYAVSMIEQNHYLKFVISGDRRPGQQAKDSIDAWTQIFDTCRAMDNNLILVIFKLSGSLPVMEAFKIVEHVAKNTLNRQCVIALVDLNEVSRKDNRLGATVAANRGLTIRVFDNEPAAEEWLKTFNSNHEI